MTVNQIAEVSPKYLVEAAERLLPVGYKQTEVGLIPKDWKVFPLRKLLKESPKYGINAPAVQLEGKLPVYIRITDISVDGHFRPSERVGVNSPLSINYHLENGDLVLARTGASVGKSYLYKEEDGVLVYAGFLIKVSPDQNELEPRFLFQYLQTQRYWSWVIVNSMRSGQPGINGNEYGSLPIPCPKLQEQTAIANALSDVDALIQELEKLIAKKQAIKTATMQQLLTGRTRLPQFAYRADGSKKGYKQSELGEIPEDWDTPLLSSMVSSLNAGVSVNSVDKLDAFTHGKHILKTSCVTSGYFFESEVKSILPMDLNRAKCSPEAGCIIVSRMNTPALVGEIGYVKKDYPEMFLPDRLWQMKFKAESSLNSRWLAYVLSYPSIAKKIKDAATGTSDSMKNISKESLLALLVPTPAPEEQTAIATILSDMDEEIQALEQRLSKTRQIKQGMMQELLTGKTRLVKPAEPA